METPILNTRILSQVSVLYSIELKQPITIFLDYTESGTWWATLPLVGKQAIMGAGRSPDEAVIDLEENFELAWTKPDQDIQIKQALLRLVKKVTHQNTVLYEDKV